MRARRLFVFIAIIQSVLFLTHFLLYETWAFSPAGRDSHGTPWIKLLLGFLSVSFVAASLLAMRYTNPAVRTFYRVAAVWVGLLTFLLLAAVASWIIFGLAGLAGRDMNFHRLVELLFGAALLTGLYGVFNARLDTNHADDSAAGQLAGSLARAKSGAGQRSPPGARAQRQFSAAYRGQNIARRAGRDFYRRRFV